MMVKVSLSISPHQLQIIDDALRMYAFVNRQLRREDLEHPLDGYKLNVLGDDERKLAMRADEIRQTIGLK